MQFFDTFIVIEILPYTLETEFLIITPSVIENSELFTAMESSATITSLFTALSSDPVAKLGLYLAIDHLLEYLRTGK